jgi:hypothetical protein
MMLHTELPTQGCHRGRQGALRAQDKTKFARLFGPQITWFPPSQQQRQSLPVLPNLPSTLIIASFQNLSMEVRQTHIPQPILQIGLVETPPTVVVWKLP